MIGRNAAGEITFTADDRDELASSFKEVLTGTAIGQTYRKDYYTKERSDDDAAEIIFAAQRVAGGPTITTKSLERALELLIDSGEIKPKHIAQAAQLEEPEEDLRPRDKNGKLLNESQLRYQEYRTWSETANSSERKLRTQSDPGYAAFVRKAYQAEMAHEIDGAVSPVGQPTTKSRASDELKTFAQKFLVEPSANLRPKNGMVSLQGELIPWPTFNDLLNRATAARLL